MRILVKKNYYIIPDSTLDPCTIWRPPDKSIFVLHYSNFYLCSILSTYMMDVDWNDNDDYRNYDSDTDGNDRIFQNSPKVGR